MVTKDAYQALVQSHIDELYESVELHERHLQSTESISRESNEAALHELKKKHRHLKDLLSELEAAGEHAWHDLRALIDTGIDDMKKAIEHARGGPRAGK